MEVETRIAKQYKCQYCCSCKNYRGKGIEGENKVSLRRFLTDQKIASSEKKCVLGHPKARATSYITHYDYGPQKMPLTLAV